jgi:hypothetical protein
MLQGLPGMIGAVARGVLALAIHCLGERRREWALAMEAEFDAAERDGKPLAFAVGCLITAWREMPAHDEGRLAMAIHALALGLVIPTSALLLSSVMTGFPDSYLGQVALPGLALPAGGPGPLLNESNRSAVLPLWFLINILAGAHFQLAWLLLERDWTRVAATAMLIASVTLTLVILSSLAFDRYASPLAQAGVLGLELASISALARWHDRLSLARSCKASPGEL